MPMPAARAEVKKTNGKGLVLRSPGRPGGGGALDVEGIEQEVAEDPDPQGDRPLVGAEARAVQRASPPGPAPDPQEEIEAGRLPGQEGEVLGDHLRLPLDDLIFPQEPDEGRRHGRGQLRIIKDGRIAPFMLKLVARAVNFGDIFDDTLHELGIFFRLASLRVRIVPSRTTRSAMMLRREPPGDGADREDRGIGRVRGPADDRLERCDDLRGDDHRVDTFLGPGPVGALALDRDGEAVGRAVTLPGAIMTVPRLSGQTRKPKTAEAGGLSRAPSRTMTSAPPSSPAGAPSSAGWKRKVIVPLMEGLRALSTRAVPRTTELWTSWPQACMTPGFRDL